MIFCFCFLGVNLFYQGAEISYQQVSTRFVISIPPLMRPMEDQMIQPELLLYLRPVTCEGGGILEGDRRKYMPARCNTLHTIQYYCTWLCRNGCSEQKDDTGDTAHQ